MHKFSLIITLFLFFTYGCEKIDKMETALTDHSPYEEYINTLEKAELRQKPMVEKWIRAGQNVFEDSILIKIPYSEQGFISAGDPEARSYLFELKEGQVLEISGMAKIQNEGSIFLDLYKRENNRWKRIASTDTLFLSPYEFNENTICLLRIQPELLVDTYYTLNINILPELINPVAQSSDLSIGSLYGVPRDAGERKHEGVDIFASRGTPVVAPANGSITRVGTNKLGGKIIWMRDKKSGHSYYFAHLDSQLVTSGTRVNQGDTIGLVGNTGNARHTPPHLHFGIYESGSRNPINYLRTIGRTMIREIDTTIRREGYEVTSKYVNLRAGPSTSADVIETLKANTFLNVIAKADKWYRILLPNQQQGYVAQTLIDPVVDEQRSALVKSSTYLLSNPDTAAIPKTFLEKDLRINRLAQYENFYLVETQEGQRGWIEIDHLASR